MFTKTIHLTFKIGLPDYPSGWGIGFPIKGPAFKSARRVQDQDYSAFPLAEVD